MSSVCRAGALLMEATEKAQRIPQLLPGNKPLRARYISFLHRMVGCSFLRLASCRSL